MQNIDNTERGIGFLERVIELVKKYSFFDFLKTFAIILITAAIIGFISNPEYIFEKYQTWSEQEHADRIEQRMMSNQKINHILDKFLYRFDASRIIILELHNGNENSHGLPFSKCSATYESLNQDIYPVSNQYQNSNLSLMPFATFMFKENYWCGDTDDIEAIDRGLYYKLKGNGTEHFACSVIYGVDKPLAFIFVSYQEVPSEHSCDYIKDEMNKLKLELALNLELKKR